MSDDASEAAVFRTLMEAEARPAQTLTEWLKEKPVRRGRLLLWMMEHTDTESDMDEIVTALVSAVKIKSLPQDGPLRDSLRGAIATWTALQPSQEADHGDRLSQS